MKKLNSEGGRDIKKGYVENYKKNSLKQKERRKKKPIIKKMYSKLPLTIKRKIRKVMSAFDNFSDLNLDDKKNINVKKTIIILGMGRSGTSVVGNILYELGVNMGEDLSRDSKNHGKGYFENRRIKRLNKHLLARGNGSWDNPPSEKTIKQIGKSKRINNLIEKILLSEADILWGWKDPRTSLLIDLYWNHLKNPYFVYCKRNPLSIAKSLKKRHAFSIKKGLKLTKEYNKRIEKFLKKRNPKVIIVNYERLIKNPNKEIVKLKKFLGIMSKKEINVVNKNLKHN